MTWGANTSHKFLQIPNETMFRYNSWDCHNTARLAIALLEEQTSENFGPGQRKWYTEVVQPLQLAVLDMSTRGVPVDLRTRKNFTQQLEGELEAATQAIRNYAESVGFSFTPTFPSSHPQVRKLLFEHLGLKGAGRTNKGRGREYATDLKNLVSVLKKFRARDQPHRELLYNLCHRSRLKTVRERYCDFPTRGGRVYPTVKITGTKTFRYAYADPALQQFPPETRVFLGTATGKGNLLLGIDYSQLEARILAILAEDQVSLGVFDRGKDVHAQNACDLFGISPEQWAALDAEPRDARRNHAKSFLYRISYGGEGATESGKEYCPCPACAAQVPPTVNLSKKEELAAEARWFAAHTAVRRFHDNLIKDVDRLGYYENPFGLRRYFATPAWDDKGRREILNCPMQLTGACIINRAQVKLHQAGAPIILQWHDALYFELPEECGRVTDQRIADYRGVMEEHVPELGASFPCDAEIGYNLGKAKRGDVGGLEKV